MVQRIQTVYLLLVAVLMALTAYAPLMILTGPTAAFTSFSIGIVSMGEVSQTLYNTWGVITFACLGAAIAFINIFMYKKRKTQLKLSNVISIFIILFYITLAVYTFVAHQKLSLNFQGIQYGIILPVVAFVFNMLAKSKIKSDEKLVRSLDRIR